MKCLGHKVEGASPSQGHVGEWPAQLRQTILLVGMEILLHG